MLLINYAIVGKSPNYNVDKQSQSLVNTGLKELIMNRVDNNDNE